MARSDSVGRQRREITLAFRPCPGGQGHRLWLSSKVPGAKEHCQKLMICYHKKDGFQWGPQRINARALCWLLPNGHTHSCTPIQGQGNLAWNEILLICRERRKPEVWEVLGGCVLLTWASHVKEPEASAPKGNGRASAKSGSEGDYKDYRTPGPECMGW